MLLTSFELSNNNKTRVHDRNLRKRDMIVYRRFVCIVLILFCLILKLNFTSYLNLVFLLLVTKWPKCFRILILQLLDN